eukprot:scaffold29663_cov12-Tisochrysis_lutea.AAC.1
MRVLNKQLHNPVGLSQQDNGVDCGAVAFAYMKEIHRSKSNTARAIFDFWLVVAGASASQGAGEWTRAIREVFSLLVSE